jgi:hypothetical protein
VGVTTEVDNSPITFRNTIPNPSLKYHKELLSGKNTHEETLLREPADGHGTVLRTAIISHDRIKQRVNPVDIVLQYYHHDSLHTKPHEVPTTPHVMNDKSFHPCA